MSRSPSGAATPTTTHLERNVFLSREFLESASSLRPALRVSQRRQPAPLWRTGEMHSAIARLFCSATPCCFFATRPVASHKANLTCYSCRPPEMGRMRRPRPMMRTVPRNHSPCPSAPRTSAAGTYTVRTIEWYNGSICHSHGHSRSHSQSRSRSQSRRGPWHGPPPPEPTMGETMGMGDGLASMP